MTNEHFLKLWFFVLFWKWSRKDRAPQIGQNLIRKNSKKYSKSSNRMDSLKECWKVVCHCHFMVLKLTEMLEWGMEKQKGLLRILTIPNHLGMVLPMLRTTMHLWPESGHSNLTGMLLLLWDGNNIMMQKFQTFNYSAGWT